MKEYELIIKSGLTFDSHIDLDKNFDIALNYEIGDVQDITKKNTCWSKTITVPSTPNNDKEFGSLFDVYTDFSFFNPNKKIECVLLKNGVEVFDGFVQLKRIKKIYSNSDQGSLYYYDLVFFDSTNNFITLLQDQTLGDLDFNKYNHIYNIDSITQSWTNTCIDGYTYPLYADSTTSTTMFLSEYFPSVYSYTILSEIVRQSGFGLTGSLLDDPFFQKEIILYTGGSQSTTDQDQLAGRMFNVGAYGAQDITGNWPPFLMNYYMSGNNVIDFPKKTSPYSDVSGGWLLNTWTCQESGVYTFTYEINGTFTTLNVYGDTIYRHDGVDVSCQLEFYIERYAAGNWRYVDNSYLEYILTYQTDIDSQDSVVHVIITGPIESNPRQVNKGELIRLYCKVKKLNSAWSNNAENPTFFTPGWTFTVGNTSKFKNTPKASMPQIGDIVNLSNFLGDKIKQKDFINDIIKRYNLFVYTDQNANKLLHFDTYNTFYDNAQVIDLSLKRDYSKEETIEFLSELQNKIITYTYKADSDIYNKTYTEETNKIFGQYSYEFDNDFIVGESKIESLFSPTPLVKTFFNAYGPAIDGANPKANPRVVFYGGIKNCDTYHIYYTLYDEYGEASQEFKSFNTYGYAGHFNDPLSPTMDLNFGQAERYFYDLNFNTTNNLFNNYYYERIKEIERCRLLVCYVYLNENDIYRLKNKMNTIVWMGDSYYKINKISDYKLFSETSTKMELIKIEDYPKWPGYKPL